MIFMESPVWGVFLGYIINKSNQSCFYISPWDFNRATPNGSNTNVVKTNYQWKKHFFWYIHMPWASSLVWYSVLWQSVGSVLVCWCQYIWLWFSWYLWCCLYGTYAEHCIYNPKIVLSETPNFCSPPCMKLRDTDTPWYLFVGVLGLYLC